MISDRKQYIGIKNNIVFELFQFLFMLEWILACISRFSAHIPTSFSVFMPNICCLDKLDNKHYAYRLIMMWEYGQKNEKYWPGSIPAHIRIGKVLNVVIFDTNNCLFRRVLYCMHACVQGRTYIALMQQVQCKKQKGQGIAALYFMSLRSCAPRPWPALLRINRVRTKFDSKILES